MKWGTTTSCIGLGVLAALAGHPLRAGAQPLVLPDPPGDALILRTDLDADGQIDPATQRLPDILEMRIGAFRPDNPSLDRYTGNWDDNGEYFRFDVVLEGLLNPPGPLAFDNKFPSYDPFLYGGNPIYGYIEFDLDADENTGGELLEAEHRYLGNVARLGGMPSDPRFAGRVAENSLAFDFDIQTPPFVDRSGEEFHMLFLGEEISTIFVVSEAAGGDPALFEAGEIWDVEGDLFHRAHGFEQFEFMCIDRPGPYEPTVLVRFAHDTATDQTTISLVFPFMNAASGALENPPEPVQPNNGCASGNTNAGMGSQQTSILEALIGLQFSAANPNDPGNPDFQLLAGWAPKNPSDFLDPTAWRIATCLGTAYEQQGQIPDLNRWIWTDMYPDPIPGDFDGDTWITANDTTLLNDFISLNDGVWGMDDDMDPNNGSIDLFQYADNFSLFDTNYDGFVVASDVVLLGDMDLNQIVDILDVDDFVLALLDPTVYTDTHGGVDPLIRGDINSDGFLNGEDIIGFVDLLINP
ncbi:MAG: hypothetical protein ACE5EC_03050 [Phycisphaerae bacterium]